MGGTCYFNICGGGETLLTKDIDLYIKELLMDGHYGEVVTNLTATPVIKKILNFDKELLKHLEFKCSFHYLELKKKNLLDTFVNNVKLIWENGCSANIELCPSDDLIPYIDEIKEFSLKNFGALPHLTIARDDRTSGIEILTNMPIDEYIKVWSQFDSDFWKFKMDIFQKKVTDCYAGYKSVFIDLSNGNTSACYSNSGLKNIFEDINNSYDLKKITQCPFPYCYNGHALLSLGLSPNIHKDIHYGNLRDREMCTGGNWLQNELKDFFNKKVKID